MAWIKMRTNLWDDPRVSGLADATDTLEATVIGGLYWLWSMADQHTEDGILPSLTLSRIDRKTGIPGFGQALCDIGWLDAMPAGVRIMRFDEHNGTSAKRRSMEAKRKAGARTESGSGPQGGGNPSACDADEDRIPPDFGGGSAVDPQDVRDPSASHADKNRTPPGARVRGRVITEAKASDAAASKPPGRRRTSEKPKAEEDPVKREIWGTGRAVLTGEGIDAADAGSFLGKLIRDYGQQTVLEVVRSADLADPKPMALREWMTAACLRANGRRLTPVSGRANRAAQFSAGLDAALEDNDMPPEGVPYAADDRTIDTTAHRID